ncbi:MAG: riboflavin synthase [Lachnospiraceae bacterium]|nr:riboflavin synthase [Lachnospiraceae bacterium]
MFTGIIEEIGTIKAIENSGGNCRLSIYAPKILEGTKLGDSIAVNGICLTASSIKGSVFQADVMGETLRRTSLGKLSNGSRVNLERALTLNARLGGHIVSGHIDGTGTIQSVKKEGNAFWYKISTGKEILKYMIEKGSITIDGISLTVALVESDSFLVSIIPHTRQETILGEKKEGDLVNLENDLIGKYVERLMQFQEEENTKEQSAVSMDFLKENGFL